MGLREQIEVLIEKANKGSIVTLGEDTTLCLKRWDTGIPDLNKAIGGGMPCGRIVELYGSEGAGKTSLLYHLLSLHDLALDIPIEGTYDPDLASVYGCQPDHLYVYRAQDGEDALNQAVKWARVGVPIIGIDSVPALTPREDIEKLTKSVNKDQANDMRIGGIARLLSKYLPLLEQTIEASGTTVVFINQVRDKMGAMPFTDNLDTVGGHALKHACSLRIKMARKEWIEVPSHDDWNMATNRKIGMVSKLRVVKSKVCTPLAEVEIPMIFNRGIVAHEDIEGIRKEEMSGSCANARKKS